jgi:class 3 adenylate cyclase/CHASE3 domain sensor protein
VTRLTELYVRKISFALPAWLHSRPMSPADQPFNRRLGLFARLNRPVRDFVARLPLRLELKLIVAVLGAVGLLVLFGLGGLAVLAENNRRTETLIDTQLRIDAYQDLEDHSQMLMITLASALWMPAQMADSGTDQLDHLKRSLAALHAASADEAAHIEEIRRVYAAFLDMVQREIGLLRSGDIDQAGAMQIDKVMPQSTKIEQLTDNLVGAARVEMKNAIDDAHRTYRQSRESLIAFILAAALIGIYLAHTISTFVVEPLREIGWCLGRIAAGEFAQRIKVPNRDEIRDLAENVNRTAEQLGQLYADIEIEKERSEALLFQMLPRPIVLRIKDGETLIADRVTEATILFSDIVGFTELSDHLAPEEVVDVLDVLFSRYDALSERNGLEKIKTIGDAYMVSAGVMEPRADHAVAIAEMALSMRAATDIATRALGVIGRPLQVRIGMHSGPLVAGVIGSSKLVYDVWGDTVNTASRMEHYGEAGRIAVSAATRELLGSHFRFEARELIEVKGKGAMETFFLERRIGPSLHRNRARRLAAARALEDPNGA